MSGRRRAVPKEIEHQLVAFAQESWNSGRQLSRNQFKEAARFLIDSHNPSLSQDLVLSDSWSFRFSKRHKIDDLFGRKSKNIPVDSWFELIQRYLEENNLDSVLNDSSRVWRCDDAFLNIGTSGKLEMTTTGEGKQAIFFFSASGKALKPHLLIKEDSKDTNFTPEMLARYFEDDFVPQLQDLAVQFPILLFLSRKLPTHEHILVIQTCRRFGIVPLSLYSETSDKSLLTYLSPTWDLINFEDLNFTSSNLGFTKSSIKDSFKESGLFPWKGEDQSRKVFKTEYDPLDEENIAEVTFERPLTFKCRACRREGDEDFVSMAEEELVTLFRDLTGITLDDVPSFICMKCKIQLENFGEFQRLCLSSHEAFEAEKGIKDQIPNLIQESILEFHLELKTDENPENNQKLPEMKTLAWQTIDKVVCDACDALMERHRFLNHWLYTHRVDPEPSSCTECGKFFQSVYKLEFHMRKKHGILKCVNCDRIDYVGARPSAVKGHKNHMKRCTNFSDHYIEKCELCERKFATEDTLRQHRKICRGSSELCETCGASVPLNVLFYHKKAHQKSPYICRMCPRVFQSVSGRNYHESIHHIPAGKRFLCAHCPMKCGKKLGILRHLKRCHFHQKKEKKACPFCGKFVATLSTHILTHRTENEMQCPFPGCQKILTNKMSFFRHKYSHTKTRPYNCTLCSTGYYQTAYLRDHYKRTHGIEYAKGETPFRKGECNFEDLLQQQEVGDCNQCFY